MQSLGPLVLWSPNPESLDWRVIALAFGCAIMLLRLHWGMTRVLLLAALGGVLLSPRIA